MIDLTGIETEPVKAKKSLWKFYTQKSFLRLYYRIIKEAFIIYCLINTLL
jgi:hypothetical protein